GALEREIQVQFDPRKVESYDVSLDQLRSALTSENVNLPVGSLSGAGRTFDARLLGVYDHPADLANLTVLKGAAGSIYVRDIATVHDVHKEAVELYRVDGQNAI